MTTIYKYPAPIDDEIKVLMHNGAQPLCVQIQHGEPTLWALVDTDDELTMRTFHWRGTGHPADNLGRYVGTIQQAGGSLIFHLFEAPRDALQGERDPAARASKA